MTKIKTSITLGIMAGATVLAALGWIVLADEVIDYLKTRNNHK